MEILVTGVAGFAAPHVATALAAAGHGVVGFDARAIGDGHGDGDDGNGDWHRSVPTVVGDLLDEDALAGALAGVEVVCHLAGVGDARLAASDPVLASRNNLVATAGLAVAAARRGVRALVLASTWEVYGQASVEPVTEEQPCHPVNPYGISKLAAERMALAVGARLGLAVVALRLGTIYGPGMRATTAIRRFIAQGLAGEHVTVNGTGKQFRQFTHVSDVARAFDAGCAPLVPSGSYNVAAPDGTTILELAGLVAERVGGSARPAGDPAAGLPVGRATSDVDAFPQEPPSIVLSCEKARRVLGWSAAVPFVDGLASLVDHYARVSPSARPG